MQYTRYLWDSEPQENTQEMQSLPPTTAAAKEFKHWNTDPTPRNEYGLTTSDYLFCRHKDAWSLYQIVCEFSKEPSDENANNGYLMWEETQHA